MLLKMKKSESVEIIKLRGGEAEEMVDLVAVEEPLQITVDGVPIAVVMRTVGDDADLVMGFLMTEGIIDDVGAVRRIDLEQKQNHALVFLEDDVQVDLARLQRNLYSASSCGICGKASIDEVFLQIKVTEGASAGGKFSISREALVEAPSRLKDSQDVFEQTGGLHAAGLFNGDGELLIIREDVGRHNAIDKVIGQALVSGVDLRQVALQLSGRVSFEVVQKALMVGIPLVSAISAPTSLAIDFAKRGDLTLVGFMRGERMNIYSGADRINW
ncbi:MAG: formate dehydrogenase accessory sulfurtransferase FdhD [Akkermansiaceae bacterium]